MRLPSGVPGFDEMIQGGLPAGASIVLQGPPGQEKLRFALTFLAEGLKGGGSGLVVVASQSPDAILSELRGLGVDLDKAVQENRLRIVDWYSQREEPVQDVEERGIVLRSSIDLTNVGVALSRAIAALGGDQPKRAVVEIFSPATSVYEVGQVYAFAQSSKGKFVRFNFTALYLLEKEMHAPPDLSTLHQPFDGVIEIERARIGDAIVRKIGVLHLKDTTPVSAFRILETVPEGLRVVHEPTKPSPVPESPSTIPPPIRAPPRPSTEGLQKPSPPLAAKPAGPTRPAVFETKEESPTRAYLIMQIARERLKLNPGDPDALFAMAAAQATLDDSRGALDALDRLAKIDDRYPGLWVLKTKLHARLGELDKARQSRERAEQATEWEEEELTVPCPLCEAPVAEGASRCPRCGATFLTDAKITDELDALGHAVIQEKVQEELGSGPPGPPERPPKPESPKPELLVKPQVVAPPKKAEKPTAKQGLTNGFVRERPAARPPGMTNGLKGRTNGLTNGLRGRTNGLRGRTNGLTNGVGRTNGLTNGLRGRTNGLTNGLGRTNGLASAAGRTNGLTNGLVSLRRGITNGLTNGNGFTNGLGSPRFQREVRLNRWKLYVIPVVAVTLLVVPLFTSPDFTGPSYPIQIDGRFLDWSIIPKIAIGPTPAIAPAGDIVEVALVDNIDFLSFYVGVQGTALEGGPEPDRFTDAFFIFLDTDRSPLTGYRVQGLGADRLIELSGRGGNVRSARLFEFDANRDVRDWSGWIKPAQVAAAASGNALEFQANWLAVANGKGNVQAAFASRTWDGRTDVAGFSVPSESAFVVVEQDTLAPQTISGTGASIARLSLRGVGGPVRIVSLNVTLEGTFTPASLSSLTLVDGFGTPLSQKNILGSIVTFDLPSLTLDAGQTAALEVRPSVALADETTVGARIASPYDIVVEGGGVSLQGILATAASLGYVGGIPAGVRVDGGFSEWSNMTGDPIGDGRPSWSEDHDLSWFAFKGFGGTTYFYAETAGAILNGTLIPASPTRDAVGGPGGADSDRDGVPDTDDLFPFDFNNDGIPDSATGNDYDDDGVVDYGAPGGTDVWLNTTIPVTFPLPYAGRNVTLYIGPVEVPEAKGEDLMRFFLDQDGNSGTGYAIGVIGADYLIEVTGKGGLILSSVAMGFSGTTPGQWAWTTLGPSASMKDFRRVEVSLPGVLATNASRAYLQLLGWGGRGDDVGLSSFVYPGDPLVIGSGGGSRWSPGTSTWSTTPSLPGGFTWTDIATTSGNDTYAIATDTTVYKLASGGSSWTLFLNPAGNPNQPVTNAAGIATDHQNTFYTITKGQTASPVKKNQLYRYTGTSSGTWSSINQNIGPFDLTDTDWASGTGSSAALYATQLVPASKLVRSTDGGGTWAEFGTTLPAANGGGLENAGLTVYPSATINVLLSNGTIERSTDTATSWSWIPKSGSSPSGNVWKDIATDVDGNLWAIADSTGLKVWKYTVGTAIWSDMTGSVSLTGPVAISAVIPEFQDVVLPVSATIFVSIGLRRRARSRSGAHTE